MPRYTLVCRSTAHFEPEIKVLIRKSTKELAGILCPDCKAPMMREPEGPSSNITEVLDNGMMARKVERPADAERLYKERAKEDLQRVLTSK